MKCVYPVIYFVCALYQALKIHAISTYFCMNYNGIVPDACFALISDKKDTCCHVTLISYCTAYSTSNSPSLTPTSTPIGVVAAQRLLRFPLVSLAWPGQRFPSTSLG